MLLANHVAIATHRTDDGAIVNLKLPHHLVHGDGDNRLQRTIAATVMMSVATAQAAHTRPVNQADQAVSPTRSR
ncbi:hypothetical protein [Dactylosporangium sp. NPDC048998]|uniref:hypothetical protein n=1 Tax=Dactylosporangium sp. NPDC048998 TaxID=3363976 RepID=UPI00371644DF